MNKTLLSILVVALFASLYLISPVRHEISSFQLSEDAPPTEDEITIVKWLKMHLHWIWNNWSMGKWRLWSSLGDFQRKIQQSLHDRRERKECLCKLVRKQKDNIIIFRGLKVRQSSLTWVKMSLQRTIWPRKLQRMLWVGPVMLLYYQKLLPQ